MTAIDNRLPDTGDASDALFRLINGFRVSRMISLAAQLGLADLLADRPLSSAELAARTAMHPLSLYRLLRAL